MKELPIVQVALENDGRVFVCAADELEAADTRVDRSLALLAVSGAAVALAVLPATVALAIVLGTTVPLEFGAAAGLAILGALKLIAMGSGFVAATRGPRLRRAAGFD